MDCYKSMAMSLGGIYESHSISLQRLEKATYSSEFCGQKTLKAFPG